MQELTDIGGFSVLIHPSRETIYDDLISDSLINIYSGEKKIITVSKTILKSINSKHNPCVNDTTLIQWTCKINWVCRKFSFNQFIKLIVAFCYM